MSICMTTTDRRTYVCVSCKFLFWIGPKDQCLPHRIQHRFILFHVHLGEWFCLCWLWVLCAMNWKVYENVGWNNVCRRYLFVLRRSKTNNRRKQPCSSQSIACVVLAFPWKTGWRCLLQSMRKIAWPMTDFNLTASVSEFVQSRLGDA